MGFLLKLPLHLYACAYILNTKSLDYNYYCQLSVTVTFDTWMKSICPGLSLPQLPALKSYIGRIETKIKELKRNHRDEEIKSVMKEPFLKECQQPYTSTLNSG